MQVIILIGAPGAGKGTLADGLKAELGMAHVSTGDMLRAAVKDQCEVGRASESYMDSGELVPDDLMMGVVEERLNRGDSPAGYMLDGFPRTLRQAEMLDEWLADKNTSIISVLYLDADRELLLKRLTGRRICRDCGTSFHVVNIPPKTEDVCDNCGGELYQRADDCTETIANRLDVFEARTRDLLGYYASRGKMVKVPAGGSAEAAEQAALAALASV